MNAKQDYYTEYRDGIRYMECKVCGSLEPVSDSTTAFTCSICVSELYNKEFPMEFTKGYKPTGKPRGWAFMKEYVDKDGNVYHKGKEQPKLKGTLPPTVIKKKPPKPKLTKSQKAQRRANLLTELHVLKKKLNKAKLKKDIRKLSSQIKKIQKQIK
tara:strand:- start:113 stop:580 length:468 start_codon:yes stop_codon:yes gene_type:complete